MGIAPRQPGQLWGQQLRSPRPGALFRGMALPGISQPSYVIGVKNSPEPCPEAGRLHVGGWDQSACLDLPGLSKGPRGASCPLP